MQGEIVRRGTLNVPLDNNITLPLPGNVRTVGYKYNFTNGICILYSKNTTHGCHDQ